jgi:enamine deaminase RidA (YjgF/YER057c/UK114 family)
LTVGRFSGQPPSPWEGAYGFSRTVRAGPFVLVAGTTSVNVDGVVIGDTPYEQARLILGKIVAELERAGAQPMDVVRTRAYVTDISRADDVGRAHGELFGAVRPVMTMVEVSALIDPRMLVEIEAEAVVE